MKKGVTLIVLCSFIALATFAQQSLKKDPAGVWKFSIPEAPDGYRSGTLSVGLADNKYSANMLFPEYNIKIPAEKVSFARDSLLLTMYAEGQEVTIRLKMTDPLIMEGKAFYSEGELPLLMTREKNER